MIVRGDCGVVGCQGGLFGGAPPKRLIINGMGACGVTKHRVSSSC